MHVTGDQFVRTLAQYLRSNEQKLLPPPLPLPSANERSPSSSNPPPFTVDALHLHYLASRFAQLPPLTEEDTRCGLDGSPSDLPPRPSSPRAPSVSSITSTRSVALSLTASLFSLSGWRRRTPSGPVDPTTTLDEDIRLIQRFLARVSSVRLGPYGKRRILDQPSPIPAPAHAPVPSSSSSSSSATSSHPVSYTAPSTRKPSTHTLDPQSLPDTTQDPKGKQTTDDEEGTDPHPSGRCTPIPTAPPPCTSSSTSDPSSPSSSSTHLHEQTPSTSQAPENSTPSSVNSHDRTIHQVLDQPSSVPHPPATPPPIEAPEDESEDEGIIVSLDPFLSVRSLEIYRLPPLAFRGWRRIQAQLNRLTIQAGSNTAFPAPQILLHDAILREMEGEEGSEPEDLSPGEVWPLLRYLNLASNAWTDLPLGSLRHASRLTHISLARNLLNAVPPALADLPRLRILDLSNNLITGFAGVDHILGNIQTLLLKGNRLESLAGLDRLWALERVDVRSCGIHEVDELGRLASLPGCTILAAEGNPLCEKVSVTPFLSSVDMSF